MSRGLLELHQSHSLPKLTRRSASSLTTQAAPAAKKAPPAARKGGRFVPVTAAKGVSKQRPFKLGGPTGGKEGVDFVYDDGLTTLERNQIDKGEYNALTGGAKLAYFFRKVGRGF